jgi:hypothetical protein
MAFLLSMSHPVAMMIHRGLNTLPFQSQPEDSNPTWRGWWRGYPAFHVTTGEHHHHQSL